MFGFFNFGLPGLIVMAAALIHFVRRQPESYWLWVILLLGPIGSLIYLATQALPELRDPGAFKFVGRGRRIRELEYAVSQNPSAGNYEELGQLYLDKGQWAKARACFDRSIAQRTRLARSLLPPRPGRIAAGRFHRRRSGPGAGCTGPGRL